MANTILAFQLIGAGAGFLFGAFDNFFTDFWFGAMVVTFPGALVGILVQRKTAPAALVENRIMVTQLTSVSALLSVVSVLLLIFRDRIAA